MESSYAKIISSVFEAPIMVHNYMQFGMLRQKFNSNVLVVYCNPQEHGYDTYNAVLKALCKSRKQKPLNIKPNKDGEVTQE